MVQAMPIKFNISKQSSVSQSGKKVHFKFISGYSPSFGLPEHSINSVNIALQNEAIEGRQSIQNSRHNQCTEYTIKSRSC